MAAEFTHGIPDEDADWAVLDAVRDRTGLGFRTILPDLISELVPRDPAQRASRPTAAQIAAAVVRLLADGRLVDAHDPKARNSLHYLSIPDPSTRTRKGLFDAE